jgi:hypothetical protein
MLAGLGKFHFHLIAAFAFDTGGDESLVSETTKEEECQKFRSAKQKNEQEVLNRCFIKFDIKLSQLEPHNWRLNGSTPVAHENDSPNIVLCKSVEHLKFHSIKAQPQRMCNRFL